MTATTQAIEKPKVNTLINTNMDDLMSVSDMIFKSGVFGDIQSAAQAAIKVLAGKEYGFDPFQSQSMFDFIQKQTRLNAHGKATLINSSGDYRLHTKELTKTNCVIDVLRKNGSGEWKVIATRTFSWQDAVDAGYTTGSNAHSYKKTPRNMLFSRCVTNVWKWDTPELETRKFNQNQIREFETPPELLVEDGSDVIDGEIVNETAENLTVNAEQEYTEPEAEAETVTDDATLFDDAEAKRVDLEAAVNDLLNEQFADDKQGRAKFLKSRNPAKLSLEELTELHGDLLTL